MGARYPAVVMLLLLLVGALLPTLSSGTPSDPGADVGARADGPLPITDRPFKMGVGPHPRNLPSPTWDDIMEGYRMAGRWGEVVNYWAEVPWYGEVDKLVGNATTRATVKALYTDNGLVPAFQTNFWGLMVRPGYGYGAWLQVPPDMDVNTTMADAEWRSRWVDHVREVAREWQMDYYCLGNEVNSFHGWHAENAADLEANLPSLMAECRAAIKEVSPDTKVVLTFRLLELYHLGNLDLLELFDATMVDVIAFTSYPSRTGLFETPADIPDDYYYRIADHTGVMPLAIAELGWTSHAAFNGSEGEQADFLLWFLEHTRGIHWEYVQWLELHDLRAEGVATSHAQTVGLRRNDGTPKAAWDVWTATYNLSYTGDLPRVPRRPIDIMGDDDLTIINGVTAGNGTPGAPYVIEGWAIDGTQEGFCLRMSDVSVHVLVRNCTLHGMTGPGGTLGMDMLRTSNCTFRDNTVRDCRRAISLDGGSADNRFHGNDLFDCDGYALDLGTGDLFDDPSGEGNYWGDYLEQRFPTATHDGVHWDRPYLVNGSDAVDPFPRVHMFGHPPIELEDHTWGEARTGDALELRAFSPVTEEMRSVEALWSLDGERAWRVTLLPLDASYGSIWAGEVDVPSDATGPLVYVIIVTGMDGGTTFSNVTSLRVLDDDPPWLVEDLTPGEATAGGAFTFEALVGDNIAVAEVQVEYWYGDGTPEVDPMAPSQEDRWALTINVGGTMEVLHYRLLIRDSAGNEDRSAEGTVPVVDGTAPVFLANQTSTNGTTGGTVTFRVEVHDDVGLAEVRVEFGDGMAYYGNETMSLVGGVHVFEYVVPPDLVGTILYRFHANDTSGNLATSGVDGIAIEDDDPPGLLVGTWLPATVGTGGRYEVTVEVVDNVGVWTVNVDMSLDVGDGAPVKSSQYLLLSQGSYSGQVTMATDQVGTLTYRVVAEDLYGNIASSEPRTADLVDVTPPRVETILPITVDRGEDMQVQVNATDNIGVVGFVWEGLPFEADGPVAEGRFDEAGIHTVRVRAVDAAGNEATVVVDILVLDTGGPSAVTVILVVGLMLALVLVGAMLLLGKRARAPPSAPMSEGEGGPGG